MSPPGEAPRKLPMPTSAWSYIVILGVALGLIVGLVIFDYVHAAGTTLQTTEIPR